MRLRREMGWKSEAAEEGEEVLGIGMTEDCFHWDGKEPVDFSRREEIQSGQGDVRSGREEMRRLTEAGVQRRSSLQTSEGSSGAITGGIGSTVKKLEKA